MYPARLQPKPAVMQQPVRREKSQRDHQYLFMYQSQMVDSLLQFNNVTQLLVLVSVNICFIIIDLDTRIRKQYGSISKFNMLQPIV